MAQHPGRGRPAAWISPHQIGRAVAAEIAGGNESPVRQPLACPGTADAAIGRRQPQTGHTYGRVFPQRVRGAIAVEVGGAVNSRALIEAALRRGVRHFIFSSTAAVYGNPARIPVCEDDPTVPTSPYGSSKLMTEIMLRDAGAAHGLRYMMLRYFNVAGADPLGRTGQSTRGATHLIKVAVETALGLRPRLSVFGTDYPTPDGTCIRDYIHVSDLIAAYRDAIAHLRAGGPSATLNCGYGRGFSVLEVIESVKRISGVDFKVEFAGRRAGDPAQLVAACDRVRASGNRVLTI
jgi:UDP-glucose 4-epimerase